jgi:hypothetical protein
MKKMVVSVLALCVGSPGLWGCGGGSSSARPLTRVELTARANAICQRVVSQVDWTKITPKELPRVVSRAAELEERGAAELDKLEPPPSMADDWRVIVDDFKATGREFRVIAMNVKRSGGAYPRLPLSNAQHERALAANVAGIKECARY